MLFDLNEEKTQPKELEDYNFVKNGEVHIPPHIWREVKESFDKKEIIEHISSIIEDQKLKYPSKTYPKSVLTKDFNRLKNEAPKINVQPWVCLRTIPKVSLKYRGKDCFIQASQYGLKVSDQEAHLNRMMCGHFEHKSPYREWTREGCKSKTRYIPENS